MKNTVGYILSEMLLESHQNNPKFVGRERKVKRLLPLVLSRGSEGGRANLPPAGKPGTERLHGRTGEACPHGEDWSGRVVRLPQGLGRVYPLFELWLNIKKDTLYERCDL